MWRHVSFIIVVGLGSTACAAATSRTGESTGRNVITAAEIVGSHVGQQFSDLYEAVLRLRPEFLRRRTNMPNTPFAQSRIVVYMNGVQYGAVESLSLIPLELVETIRYLRPAEANIRYGGAHAAGVIEVTTRNRD